MPRIGVRSAGIVAAAALVVGAVLVPGVGTAGRASAAVTVHSYASPFSTDSSNVITAMASDQDGRPWFVTGNGSYGYVGADGSMHASTIAAGHDLEGLTLASDGSMWTADVTAKTVVRIAADGSGATAFSTGIGAASIAAATDGAVWVLASETPTLARVTPSGVVTKTTFAGTVGGGGAQSLVAGPSGSAWFVPSGAKTLGRVTAAGAVTLFTLPDVATLVVLGPDGNPWAGLQGGGFATVTAAGSVVSRIPANDDGLIGSAVVGADGRIWASELFADHADVAAVTTAGKWSTYALPNASTMVPARLVAGPDGAVWFARHSSTSSGSDIATSVSTSGAVASYTLTSGVSAVTAASDGVWFGLGDGTIATTSNGTVTSGSPTTTPVSTSSPTASSSPSSTPSTTPTASSAPSSTPTATKSATSAPTKATSTRVSGTNRYATSVAIAQAAYAGTKGRTVYVATGTNYPDALAAGPAAAKAGGPLLLTAPTGLPAEVAAEITALQPKRVVVVGGTSAVSATVQTQIQAAAGPGASVVRIAGTNRFDTAKRLVADAFGSASTAYIATGTNYPDALAAAAAAGANGVPVVLVNGGASSVDASTLQLLKSLGVTKASVVGGTSAVSPGVQQSLAAKLGSSHVVRVAGANRFDTAAQIAKSAFTSGSSNAYLATGTAFPDALAGSALAGAKGAPLLTSRTDCVPAGTLTRMAALGTKKVTLIGGTSALTPAVAALRSCG